MADNGDDFDEDGIFRERHYQDEDFLDEDGIWREDGDKENFEHYTFRTDSGIGTTGRRSTSSSINKVSLDAARHGGSVNLNDYDDSFEDHQHDSFALGEKSFNISDLEASASVVDEFDFDGASFDSNQDGRVSRTRRNLSQSRHEIVYKDDLDDSEDFEASFLSDHSIGEFDSPHIPQRSRERRVDLQHSFSKNSHEGPYRSRNTSYDDGHVSRHFSDWNNRDSNRDVRPEEQRYSQSRNSQSLADYLLSGGENISSRSTNQSGSQYDDRGQQIFGRPRVVGDSIFTQEEEVQEVLSFHQQRSLMEFERLEAALDYDVKSEKSADQMDLIGAYLQGLQEQEEKEEDLETMELAENKNAVNHGAKQISFGRSTSTEGNPQVEYFPSRDHEDSFETNIFSQAKSAKSGEVRRKEFKSSKRQSGNGSGQSTKHNSREHPQTATLTANDSTENWNASLVYEESVSLLENQPPPFDSMSFSTLDMTGGTNESPSRNATLSEANNSRQSKIPMLRSRSPSMSRPESPSRARPPSPGTPQRRSQDRGRALPPTPRQSPRIGSPQRQDSKIPTYQKSSDSVTENRDASSERDFEEEEKKLDEAANILLDGTEANDVSIQSTGPGRRGSTPGPTTHTVTGPGSRPGSARSVREPKNSFSRIRASSEEALKAANKRDTKMQRSGSGTIPKQQPVKAGPGITRTMSQMPDQNEQNEETLVQLQQDYNKLLQKYAQAENTIDSLRIGATIPISVELTATGGNPNLASGNGNGTANVGTQGAGSLAGSSHKPPIGHGSRPGSARSHRITTPSKASPRTHLEDPVPKVDDLTASLSGEGEKLSLLAKSKAVDEKIHALAILLNENCLSTDDQSQALENIKDSFEKLQQESRDAKAHHDFMIRTGSLPPNEPEFDEDKIVEGELYKLSMKIDDVEQQVQENVKHKSSSRVPFKADHSININAMNNGKESDSERTGTGLPPNRPPSVGSFAGGPEGIDEQVHRLNKEYDNLMDRYRRLKQMRRTPERDLEIDGLLKNLKGIYERTPDHRKPALPPELEVNYNPVNDHFMSFESEPLRRGSVNSSHAKSQESDSLPGLSESDLATARQDQGQRRPRTRSLDYTSSATDSTARNRPKKHPQGSLTESYDSMSSSQSRKSGRGERPKQYPGFPPPGKARTREDKDSGYVGSEASRKVTPQGREYNRRTASGNPRPRQTSGNPNNMEDGEDSNVSASTSDLSTVEYVRPYGSRGSQQRKKPVNMQKDPEVARSAPNARTYTHPGKNNQKTRIQQSNRSLEDSDSDSDTDSQDSDYTTKSKGSSKKDQIQSLTDEINMLRAEIRQQDQKPQVASTSLGQLGQQQEPVAASVRIQPQAAPTQQQQYAYVYGYPMAANPPNADITQPQVHPANRYPSALAASNRDPYQPGIALNHQPMVHNGDPQMIVPGMSVGPVVHPELYNHSVPPVTQYRETNEAPPVERWETYDHNPEDYTDFRRTEYRDGERHRRSHRRDQGMPRDRLKDKIRRMRNYYMPNKMDDDMNNNERYGQRKDRYQNTPYGRACDHCNAGVINYVPGPSHPVQGTGIGGVPPPPSYQQVRREICKWCSGTGKCDHPVMVQSAESRQLQQPVNGGSSYVMVPAATAPQYAVPAPRHPQQSVLAPVELVNVESAPKVRYYVREFDGSPNFSASLTARQRSASYGNLFESKRRRPVYLDHGANSDSEGQSDLNSSLNSAIRTASELKKMSRRMKKSIRSELL